jgi:hypothetical protein
MCIFYAIKSKGNKVKMTFVTFPDSGFFGVDDGSIQSQRDVKRLFDTANNSACKVRDCSIVT